MCGGRPMKAIQKTRHCAKAGFSLVEVVMTLAIGMVLASVALPMLVTAVQGYRLTSIAQQAAHLIDLTRYRAIRRNAVISLQTTTQGASKVLYVDLNGNTRLDASEPLLLLPPDMQIANGQSLTPDPSSMGIGNTQNFAGRIAFDYRGAVNFAGGGVTSSYFLAIGYISQTQLGTRAVTVSPLGQTRLWNAPVGGRWAGM